MKQKNKESGSEFPSQRIFLICIVLSFVFHISLFLMRNFLGLGNYVGGLEQEKFLEYAQSLRSGEFPYNLPLFSLWITMFPPVVFEQTSKISTEVLVIALFLLVFFCLCKKKYLIASLLCSYATIVRPLSICIFLALLIFLIKSNERNNAMKSIAAYLIFPFFLTMFNLHFWGSGAVFYQIPINMSIGRATIGFIQWLKDVFRAIAWGQWRILISGISYTIFAFFLLTRTLRNKGKIFFKNDEIFIKSWALLSIIFIFVLGGTPFLEELRRYLAVFFPLALLANFPYFYNQKTFFYLSFLTVFLVVI